MKTILFYDTETNGLPEWKLPSEHPSQPHVTQIAAELCIEETGEAIASMDFLIQPECWELSEELQALTGLTMDRLITFGIPIADASHAFFELWLNADIRCAHNEPFDMRILRIEIMRHAHYSMEMIGNLSFADNWKESPAFCTMVNSTAICNLPPTEKMIKAKRFTPKPPNLSEAYLHFTGKQLEGAHNAKVDIMACKAIYYALKNQAAL